MTNITVFGIGSPYGVDKVGWEAIESLQKDQTFQTLTGNSINYLSLDRPGIALLDYLGGVDYAILIDAIAGGTPGKIVEVEMDQLLADPAYFSSHNAGVAEALAIGGVLNSLPQKIELIGIETGNISSHCLLNISTFKQLGQLVFDHIHSHLALR